VVHRRLAGLASRDPPFSLNKRSFKKKVSPLLREGDQAEERPVEEGRTNRPVVVG
jgi:hypothetical protein